MSEIARALVYAIACDEHGCDAVIDTTSAGIDWDSGPERREYAADRGWRGLAGTRGLDGERAVRVEFGPATRGTDRMLTFSVEVSNR